MKIRNLILTLSLICIMVLVLAWAPAVMAESATAAASLSSVTSGTATYTQTYQNSNMLLYKVTCNATTTGISGTLPYIEGELAKVVIIPGTSTAQPSEGFDVAMYSDSTGNDDILNQAGDNLTSTSIKKFVPLLNDGTTTATGLRTPLADRPRIVGTNVGNGKSFRVDLYVHRMR